MLACAAFLVLGCAIFTGPIFRGEMFFVTEPRATDIIAFGLPFRLGLQKALRAGTIPLWTPEIFCGFPLHAEGEGGFLHPVVLATSLLLPPPQALTWTILLSLAAAGLLLMLYARELGLSWGASLLAACCFAFGGHNVLKIHHPNHLLALAWMGLVFYGWERFIKTGSGKWLALAGVGWALQILASYPAYAYYGFLAVCAYALTRLKISRWAGATAVFMAVGLGLSAAQWLPTWELAALSTRSGGLSYREAASFPYSWNDLGAWVRPDFLGGPWSLESFERSVASWENASYIGGIPAALAFWGFLGALRRRGPGRFLAAMFLVAMALALQTPLYRWLWSLLPGFDYFRLSSRLLFPATFAAALLAGMGLDSLRRVFPGRRLVAVFLVAFSLADIAAFASRRYQSVNPRSWLGLPRAAMDLPDSKSRAGGIGWEGVFLSFAREAAAGRGDAWKPYLAWKELLGMGAELTWGFSGSWSGYIALAPKTLAGLQNAVRLPLRQGKVILGEAAANLMRVQAVEFLVTPGPLEGRQSELRRVYDSIPGGPRVYLYRLKRALPRAFVVGERKVAASNEQAVVEMTTPGFDPSKTVILSEDSAAAQERARGSLVRWQRDEPTQLALSVEMRGDGYLVLSDSWYPGWKAEVNGKPVRILRANGHFRALYLTAGRRQVRFFYEPLFFKLGAAVSLLSLLILAAWLGTSKPDKIFAGVLGGQE